MSSKRSSGPWMKKRMMRFRLKYGHCSTLHLEFEHHDCGCHKRRLPVASPTPLTHFARAFGYSAGTRRGASSADFAQAQWLPDHITNRRDLLGLAY